MKPQQATTEADTPQRRTPEQLRAARLERALVARDQQVADEDARRELDPADVAEATARTVQRQSRGIDALEEDLAATKRETAQLLTDARALRRSLVLIASAAAVGSELLQFGAGLVQLAS